MNNKMLMMAMLLFSPLGASAQEQTVKDTLTMDAVMRNLPEVMVKGSRPIVKAERGMLTYNIPLLLKELPADNAYDALTHIPGVSDADGGIKFSGTEVTLIINGHATTLTQEQLIDRLKAMPAAQLAKAEVMLAAPARYHVRGTAINIVTKDYAGTNQVSGQLTGGWQQGKYGAGFGKGYLSMQHGKLGVDASYSFVNGHNNSYTAIRANQLVNGERKLYDAEERQKAFGIKHDYRLGLSYAFAKDHRLEVAYTGKYNDGNGKTHSYGTGASAQRTDHSVYLHNVDVNYALPFGLQLSGSYTYYRTPQQQRLDGTLYDEARNLTNHSRQTIDKWMFAADQSHALHHGWGLSYGVKAQFSRNNSFQTTLDEQGQTLPDATSSANVTERIWNAYAGFSKQFGHGVSLEASLTGEQYHSPIWNKWRLYPTLNALWQVSPDHVLNLSFSSNSEFPSYWSTMSGTYYSSTYTEVWGNASLKPYSYYNLNLMWQYKHRYTLTAFASFKPDYICQNPYQPADRLAVVLQEFNYDYSNSFGLQASAIFRAGQWLSGNVYAVGQYSHDKASHFFDLPFDRENVKVLLGGTASLKPFARQNVRLILKPFFQSQAIQGVYDIMPLFRTDATLQWTSRDGKWGLRLVGNNIFNTKYKTRSVHDGQDYHMTVSPGWASATLAVVYKFGGYKEKPVKAVDTSRMGH